MRGILAVLFAAVHVAHAGCSCRAMMKCASGLGSPACKSGSRKYAQERERVALVKRCQGEWAVGVPARSAATLEAFDTKVAPTIFAGQEGATRALMDHLATGGCALETALREGNERFKQLLDEHNAKSFLKRKFSKEPTFQQVLDENAALAPLRTYSYLGTATAERIGAYVEQLHTQCEKAKESLKLWEQGQLREGYESALAARNEGPFYVKIPPEDEAQRRANELELKRADAWAGDKRATWRSALEQLSGGTLEASAAASLCKSSDLNTFEPGLCTYCQ